MLDKLGMITLVITSCSKCVICFEFKRNGHLSIEKLLSFSKNV